MPKFNAEIDTDAKTLTISIDGQPTDIDFESFSISSYDRWDEQTQQDVTCFYLSFSVENGNGETVSYSYGWEDPDVDDNSGMPMTYAFSQEIKKLVETAKSVEALKKVFYRDASKITVVPIAELIPNLKLAAAKKNKT